MPFHQALIAFRKRCHLEWNKAITKTADAIGSDSGGAMQWVYECTLNCFRRGKTSWGKACGQSSVEYAIVLAAFLALIVGLGAFWRLFDAGIIIEHALQSASHHLQGVASGSWSDVLLY